MLGLLGLTVSAASSEVKPSDTFENNSQAVNWRRRGARRRNPNCSDNLTSADVGIQALPEVAAENKLKLAENFTGKGDLITVANVMASGKITKKCLEQNQDELQFKLKKVDINLNQLTVQRAEASRELADQPREDLQSTSAEPEHTREDR
jgi:hypothetical protein